MTMLGLGRFATTVFWPDRYAKPAVYYVDAANGKDGYDGRSPDLPWQTVQKVNSVGPRLRPGDTVLFRRGQTWAGTRLIASANGAENVPITFGTWDTGARPVIDGQTTSNAAENFGYSHLRFVGLHFTNGSQFGLYNKTADDVWLTDCECSYAGNDGVLFLTGCTRCRVYGGRYHHSFDRDSSGNTAITGIEIADGGADFIIDGAEIDHNVTGITCHGHPGTDVPQRVIWRNLNSHDNDLNGMQVSSGGGTGTQALDLTIEDSVSAGNGKDGLAIGSSGAPAVTGLVTLRNVTIAGNTRYQISKDLATGVTVVGAGSIPITVVRP